MKKCSKCGAQIDDSQTVCPKCGEPLTQNDISQSSSLNTNPSDIKANSTESKKNRFGYMIAIIAIFVFLFIILIAALTKNEDTSTSTTTSQQTTNRETTITETVVETIPETKQLNAAEVGDFIKFGFYEQDNNTTNGKEEIIWKILAVEDTRVLLISHKILDKKKFNDNESSETTSFKNCTLRKWLNDDFINTAFSIEEQSKISIMEFVDSSSQDAEKDDGGDEYLKIFLLSEGDVNKYFPTPNERKATSTQYAANKDASSILSNMEMWWLSTYLFSTVDSTESFAAIKTVDNRGKIQTAPSDFDEGIRPVLWINR